MSQNVNSNDCARPIVAFSTDGAATWSAPSSPWKGCQDKHAVIAWSPGPEPGSSRLWAANAINVTGGMSLSITYTDNLGQTWARPFVSRATPPWVGCFPTIAVDTVVGSPNYGTVYVAYNWLASSSSVGVAVLASADGRTWSSAQVPLQPYPRYPNAWRFGYRLAVGQGGAVYLSFYESDMAKWDSNDMWDIGTPGNTGRAGFAVARITFVSSSRKLTAGAPVWAASVAFRGGLPFDPECQSQLAFDDSGGLWMAISDRPSTGGVVKVGHSPDGGRTWTWTSLHVRGQDSFKPSLATVGGSVFVAWHALASSGSVSTYDAVSDDGGATFSAPSLVTSSTFKIPRVVNETGLREAAVASNGTIYYAWGDNRSGLAIYVAAFTIPAGS